MDLLPAGETFDPFWAFVGDNLRQVIIDVSKDRELCLVDVPSLNQAPEASFVVPVVQRNLKMLRSLGTPVLGSVVNELVREVPSFVGKMV